MKRVTKKIIKICRSPVDFTFDWINGASIESDLTRIKAYVKCVKKVEREYAKSIKNKQQ